jgi:hypothetical protein
MAIPMSTAGMPSTVGAKSVSNTQEQEKQKRTDEQPLPPMKACHTTHVRDTSSDKTTESAVPNRSVLEKGEKGLNEPRDRD